MGRSGGFVVALALASVVSQGIAWGKDKAGAGRALPGPVKKALWQKACDIPLGVACPAAPAADTMSSALPGQPPTGGPLPPGCLRRSNGELYKAEVQDFNFLLWSAEAQGGLKEIADQQGQKTDEVYGLARYLQLVSGIPVDLQEDRLIQLNPALIKWIEANIVPPPNEAMCGSTAKEIYRRAYSQSVRSLASAYVYLVDKKVIKTVKLADYDKQRSEYEGPYMTLCGEIPPSHPDDYEASRLCHWWLRRAVGGGADPLAAALGRFLAKYDPAFYAPIAKKFPKK